MKAHYKLFLSLAIGSFVTFAGCQDDEVVDLVKYPVNQPAITIDGAEGASKAMLTAVYKSDGTLELDGLVTRTYTFHFAASPEDATVTFDIINTNIPKENVEISATKVVLPAGSTDASVTVALKDEDFNFAASNYDATTYELGVKASVEGYKIGTEPIESKVVIEKEAYSASCYVVGENGNSATFERAFSQGTIVNPDPISYTFKMKLDKPARKDVKVKLATTGLGEQFMNDITVTPAEIIIPAGERESADITWSITDDFLLTTADPETYTLVVTASAESEDPVVGDNKEENFLTFNVSKVFRNFGYVSDKVANWIELDKTGWSVELEPPLRNGNLLIDGKGGSTENSVYRSADWWFVVDMKSEKTMTGFGIDYYINGTPSSPQKVTISTSMDNETWVTQGAVDTPQSANHYFQFFVPQNARYVKVELKGLYNRYLDVTEVYVYNAQ
ncbi:DUF4989 domain-containing protein [Bacteroides acidifaciens]|uniref:DUF4989 domain-containing protein n=1 Tax=Bacteroides acidifaciens TaxID=85831 RepID=A0A3L8AGR1_9BACE|nr:DUF4989 domain-containing protein [Bacteroides acidifaciens]RLT81480.1 DUF4989 domain-containing protein [Bacteroides acidifaciens]